MILFIILTIAMVALIIFFAILTTKKKNPPFVPPKVETEPDLNKLDNLVGSVKKENQPEPITQQPPDNQDDTEDTNSKTSPQRQKDEKKDSIEQTTKEEKKKIGTRGRPPQKPPTLDLKQAMKSKQFLDRKK